LIPISASPFIGEYVLPLSAVKLPTVADGNSVSDETDRITMRTAWLIVALAVLCPPATYGQQVITLPSITATVKPAASEGVSGMQALASLSNITRIDYTWTDSKTFATKSEVPENAVVKFVWVTYSYEGNVAISNLNLTHGNATYDVVKLRTDGTVAQCTEQFKCATPFQGKLAVGEWEMLPTISRYTAPATLRVSLFVEWELPEVPQVRVEVNPISVSLVTGATQQFRAVVENASNTAVTWSMKSANSGSVSATGLYTAPNVPGIYLVWATSQQDPTKSDAAWAYVTEVPVIGVTVTPNTTEALTGASLQFTAQVTNAANTSVSWSVAEGAAGGTVTSSGLYTAPRAAGEYHVIATSIQDPSRTATASINVLPRALVNGGFESQLDGWNSAGVVTILSCNVSGSPCLSGMGGSYAQIGDGTNIGELEQTFDVPASGAGLYLSYRCSEDDPENDWDSIQMNLRDEVTSASVSYSNYSHFRCDEGLEPYSADRFKEFVVDLNEYAGHSVNLSFFADWPDWLQIDDIKLGPVPPPPPPPPPPVVVTADPAAASVAANGTQQFTAFVTNSTNTAVTWSVTEGALGGHVSASGLYTAPAVPGTYHVRAQSVAAPSKSATATVTVTGAVSALQNGGFESGSLAPWSTREAAIVNDARSGQHAAWLAASGMSYASLQQSFLVPATGCVLSFWYKPYCPDEMYSYIDAHVGGVALPVQCGESTWQQVTFDLFAYRGTSVVLSFYETDENGVTSLKVDDVVCY
jgi:hypothetical protein